MYVVDGGSGMFDAQGCSSVGSVAQMVSTLLCLRCLVANEGTDPATVVVPM